MELTDFDVAEYLDDAETIAAYLTEILADGDTAEFIAALGDIARAKGIDELAAQTGLGRESLYKTMSGGSKPRFDTVLKIARALNLQLSLTPKTTHPA